MYLLQTQSFPSKLAFSSNLPVPVPGVSIVPAPSLFSRVCKDRELHSFTYRELFCSSPSYLHWYGPRFTPNQMTIMALSLAFPEFLLLCYPVFLFVINRQISYHYMGFYLVNPGLKA